MKFVYILWRKTIEAGFPEYSIIGIYDDREKAVRGFNCYVDDWKDFQPESTLAVMDEILKRHNLQDCYVVIGSREEEKVFIEKIKMNETACYGNTMCGDYLKKEA